MCCFFPCFWTCYIFGPLAESYPRNWFKGQDTVSILRFLDARIESELPSLDEEGYPYFNTMHTAIRAANVFLRCMYSAALWLTNDERKTLLESGHACVKAYQQLAQTAYSWGVTRWKFQPKMHLFGEILYPLEVQKRRDLPSINPLTFGTQIDEDFVGRLATISRMVSVRTVHTRTLGRYQVALAARW